MIPNRTTTAPTGGEKSGPTSPPDGRAPDGAQASAEAPNQSQAAREAAGLPRFGFMEEVLAPFPDGDRFARVVSFEWGKNGGWVYGLKADGSDGDPFAFWGLRYFAESEIQGMAELAK